MKYPYLFLMRRFGLWLRRSLNFLWLVLVAGYLVVLAGQAVYRNYQSQQETRALQDQLTQAIQQKQSLTALLVYYQTDSFKEKELRQSLLLKKPTETMYALPESSISKTVEEEIVSENKKPEHPVDTNPIWKQWLQYIINNQA